MHRILLPECSSVDADIASRALAWVAGLAIIAIFVSLKATARPDVVAFDAIESGNLGKLRSLLASGTNPNLVSPSRCLTLLSLASQKGNLEATTALLKHGADPNATIRAADCEEPTRKIAGSTALHFASSFDVPAVIEVLLRFGAKPNPKDREGSTPLHLAAGLQSVRVLLAGGADPSSRGPFGLTPLHNAAMYRRIEVSRMLLRHGADPNAEAQIPLTMPHYHRVMSALRSRGVDTASLRPGALTPFHLAVYEVVKRSDEKTEIVDLYLNSGATDPMSGANVRRAAALGDVAALTNASKDELSMPDILGRTPMHLAICAKNGTEFVSVLSARGVDVAPRDYSGRTPIHFGAACGNLAALEVLTKKGARLDDEARDGAHPISDAVAMDRPDVVNYLLAHGATARAAAGSRGPSLAWGASVAHLAAAVGDIRILGQLHGAGLDIIRTLDQAEQTPLYVAAGEGQLDAVKFLITKGADVNHARPDGFTPLVEVLLGDDDLEVARYLIAHDADCTVRFDLVSVRRTVLFLVEDPVAAKALIECGADVNARDSDGNTVLSDACKDGRTEVAKVLLEAGASAGSGSCVAPSPHMTDSSEPKN